MKLSDLHEYKKNPRRISDRELEGLSNSIEEFGDLSGITYNLKLKALVCGHQRVKALEKKYGDLTFNRTEGIVTPTGETFAVRWVTWDKIKHEAACIIANSQAISGEYTTGVHSILSNIQAELPDLYDALNLGDIIGVPDEEEGESNGDSDSSNEDERIQNITFRLTNEQVEQVSAAIEKANSMGVYIDTGNLDESGNALSRICETFLTQNGRADG